MTEEEIKEAADRIVLKLLNSKKPWLDVIVEELRSIVKEN